MSQVRPPDYLEVEIGTYCNRTCAWCPNGWSDRGRRRTAISERAWNGLLADLGATDYRGWFAFHNYNEPLADPSLFDRIAEVRARAANARPVVYSNGDLLDRRMLDALVDSGVAEVRVTLYPAVQQMMDEPDPAVIERFLSALGLENGGTTWSKPRRYLHAVQIRGLRLLVGAPRIESYNHRAGSVHLVQLAPREHRIDPCFYPFSSAAIDVHGRLKLCCHIFDTEAEGNDAYVIGNVGETPFSELWRSEHLETLRRQLARADFTGLDACATCNHRMQPHQKQQIRRRYPAANAAYLAGVLDRARAISPNA